jgi:hypothetical protein
MPLINYIGNRQEALTGGTDGFGRGNAAPPPSISFDYLIVGGGGKTNLGGYGGGAGGFLTGSASLDFNTTNDIVVGLGASGSQQSGSISSIISPSFATLIAYGGNGGGSGAPTINSAGLGGPPPIGTGGGAGAGEVGINGVVGQSGRGGSGSMWLDGNFYAGGGGGAGAETYGAGDGTIDNGLGGGGRGAPNGSGGQAGQNGLDGKGGGAGGLMESGGSGVVIIRYTTASVVAPYDNAISGGSLSISGGYAYRTFTGSAQLVYSF